jgi:hypothetical protein
MADHITGEVEEVIVVEVGIPITREFVLPTRPAVARIPKGVNLRY